MSPTLTLPAFAKVNLRLRVIGKRADGYHDLDTIFQTISLHDTIEFACTDSSQIELYATDPSLSLGEDNLVIRAAKALQTLSPDKGIRIRLEKRIPVEAGLGGGSSDAAITLTALNLLWELNLSKGELTQIASKLGSDVPFFFYGGTGRATGLGDQIETLDDAAEKFLLIVKPNTSVKTSDAYRALDECSLTSKNSKTILSTSQRHEFFDNVTRVNLTNDFEAVAFDLQPEILRAKTALMNAGANAALLAGSGSAVFGIFDSKDAQRRAIQAIELETGWRVFPCKTVGRDQYREEMGDLRQLLI